MGRRPEAALSTGPTAHGVGIAVSPHYLASEAGIEILRTGGSAVDAAIAVNAVLSVVLPDTCGPGGDLFALIHEPGMSTPAALNASGRSGTGVTADEMRDDGFGEIPHRSPWSITVPGCVDGWEALHDKYGKVPLARSLEAAIEYATSGFPVSTELSKSLQRIRQRVHGQDSAPELFPDGVPPEPGSALARPAFARTLTAIAEGGRVAFFDGEVGSGIATASGGSITPEDMSRNQSDWIEPAGLTVFGRQAWTIPPNSQGYLTLATLAVFELLSPPHDQSDPLFQHLLIEAYRSVAWEREDTATDPDHADITVEDLLASSRLADRASTVNPHQAGRWPFPSPARGGTAYMTVIDGHGAGVSLIQSNYEGIGSGLSAGSTGVWLQNRGAGFNLIQGHPNELVGGNRPLHTLSPSLWTVQDELDLIVGTRGGHQQPQFLAQFAADHYLAGLCTDDSQMTPRWSMHQPEPGTDSAISIESRFAPSTVAGLEARGHEITEARAFEPGWGPISAIDVADERKGSADPRISTSAALTT